MFGAGCEAVDLNNRPRIRPKQQVSAKRDFRRAFAGADLAQQTEVPAAIEAAAAAEGAVNNHCSWSARLTVDTQKAVLSEVAQDLKGTLCHRHGTGIVHTGSDY